MCETDQVLSFARGVEVLRGSPAAAARLVRLGRRRIEAFARALDGEYCKSDEALFGPVDELLRVGSGRRPMGPVGPAAA